MLGTAAARTGPASSDGVQTRLLLLTVCDGDWPGSLHPHPAHGWDSSKGGTTAAGGISADTWTSCRVALHWSITKHQTQLVVGAGGLEDDTASFIFPLPPVFLGVPLTQSTWVRPARPFVPPGFVWFRMCVHMKMPKGQAMAVSWGSSCSRYKRSSCTCGNHKRIGEKTRSLFFLFFFFFSLFLLL